MFDDSTTNSKKIRTEREKSSKDKVLKDEDFPGFDVNWIRPAGHVLLEKGPVLDGFTWPRNRWQDKMGGTVVLGGGAS